MKISGDFRSKKKTEKKNNIKSRNFWPFFKIFGRKFCHQGQSSEKRLSRFLNENFRQEKVFSRETWFSDSFRKNRIKNPNFFLKIGLDWTALSLWSTYGRRVARLPRTNLLVLNVGIPEDKWRRSVSRTANPHDRSGGSLTALTTRRAAVS